MSYEFPKVPTWPGKTGYYEAPMSDKTIEEMKAAVLKVYPDAYSRMNIYEDSVRRIPCWTIYRPHPGAEKDCVMLCNSGWSGSEDAAWAEAYSKLPTPEPQEASPQPNSTAPERPLQGTYWDHGCDGEVSAYPREETDAYMDALEADRDAWKARAEAAEKDAARWEECARNADGENERLQAELAQLRAEGERKDTWISVKKRLPEALEDVLASSHDGNIITGASVCDGLWFVRDGAEWHGVYVDPVTHWRPLPAPPSERDTQEGR